MRARSQTVGRGASWGRALIVGAAFALGVLGCAASASADAQIPTTSGWDYNLAHACVRSIHPSDPLYGYQAGYDGASVIGGASCSSAHHWFSAVENEAAYGASCPGPMSQSLGINRQEVPGHAPIVAWGWMPGPDQNYTLHMKTTRYNSALPSSCTTGSTPSAQRSSQQFTFTSLNDDVRFGGGPLPPPDRAVFSMSAYFNDYTPAGGARLIAGYVGSWPQCPSGWTAPASTCPRTNHIVEIDLSATGYGDNTSTGPAVITSYAPYGFILLNGARMGYRVPTGAAAATQTYYVPWNSVLQWFCTHPTGIVGGLTNCDLAAGSTTAIYVATEAYNRSSSITPGATPPVASIADLYLTDFRIADTGATPLGAAGSVPALPAPGSGGGATTGRTVAAPTAPGADPSAAQAGALPGALTASVAGASASAAQAPGTSGGAPPGGSGVTGSGGSGGGSTAGGSGSAPSGAASGSGSTTGAGSSPMSPAGSTGEGPAGSSRAAGGSGARAGSAGGVGLPPSSTSTGSGSVSLQASPTLGGPRSPAGTRGRLNPLMWVVAVAAVLGAFVCASPRLGVRRRLVGAVAVESDPRTGRVAERKIPVAPSINERVE